MQVAVGPVVVPSHVLEDVILERTEAPIVDVPCVLIAGNGRDRPDLLEELGFIVFSTDLAIVVE